MEYKFSLWDNHPAEHAGLVVRLQVCWQGKHGAIFGSNIGRNVYSMFRELAITKTRCIGYLGVFWTAHQQQKKGAAKSARHHAGKRAHFPVHYYNNQADREASYSPPPNQISYQFDWFTNIPNRTDGKQLNAKRAAPHTHARERTDMHASAHVVVHVLSFLEFSW